MKKKLIPLFVIIVLGIAFFAAPKHFGRYFYWNYADLNDYKKFSSLPVANEPEQISRFEMPGKEATPQIPGNFIEENSTSFEEFLSDHETVAFLILKKDTLLYEHYFDNYTAKSIVPSFSVSKVFISALVGIAIDEGYIYSQNQSITFYLKELKPELDQVTIKNLLNMRSGIEFEEAYNTPFADMAKYYYGTHLSEYIKSLKLNNTPGQTYEYMGVNTLLLGMIIERSTNTPLTEYLSKKIWKPLGMETPATWSIDSEENRTVKAFCCLNATARDFARFGLLYLNSGMHRGNIIVPEKWIAQSIQIANDSKDSQGYPYNYHWRVLENGPFFAKGIMGQYIIVIPEKEMVIVRLGSSYADIDWVKFSLELSKQF